MRFLRQLAAATLAVAVVAALGLAWNHYAPRSLPGEPGGAFQPVPARDVRGLPPGTAGVILLDVARRRARRIRRARRQ
jgi:hypothetical protein